LVGTPEGKRILRRPGRRWKYIRMALREIGWEGGEWMHQTQDRDQWRGPVKKIMNPRVP